MLSGGAGWLGGELVAMGMAAAAKFPVHLHHDRSRHHIIGAAPCTAAEADHPAARGIGKEELLRLGRSCQRAREPQNYLGSFFVSADMAYVLPFRNEVRILLKFLKTWPKTAKAVLLRVGPLIIVRRYS